MIRRHEALLVLVGVGMAIATLARAQAPQKAGPMIHVSGAFDVTVTPQPDSATGRQAIDKTYHGGLDATGKGEMLAAMGTVAGSGTYVAIEHVTGALGGKPGGFALQHLGTMVRGTQSLAISVVPDSGTGELAGLSGTMTIEIKDGKHFYAFDYAIAPQP